MTNFMKGLLGAIAVLIICLVISVLYTVTAIEDAGSIKSVIIDVGKEIKDIGEQIAEE